MKVIMEIDGVRHKMVKNKVKDPCNACSLSKLCANKICSPCLGGNYHFILENNGNANKTHENSI